MTEASDRRDTRAGRWQLALVILFVAGAVGASKLLQLNRETITRRESPNRALSVTAVDAAPGAYPIRFSTTGVVQARTLIAVVPEVSGRVVAIAPDFYPGGLFAADAELFAVDPREFELQVQSANAAVAQAQTALQLAEAEAEAARAEWHQLQSGEAPPLVAREPQLNEARAALAGAEATLAAARLALSRSRYTLPFNGAVIASDVALGQYLRAGQSYGQVFDRSELEIRASLDDVELRWLLADTAPEIRIHTTYLGQSQSFAGALLRGATSLDATTRLAGVRFGFEDPDVPLVPGVFATVEVQGPTLTDVTRLPSAALQKDGLLWRIREDDTLEAIDPDIVYRSDTEVVIRNLDGPARIVASRVAGASPGMRVNVAAAPVKSSASNTTSGPTPAASPAPGGRP